MIKIIKSILKPPKSDYTDYYEISRFDLTWNVVLFTLIGLVPITMFYYFFDFKAFYPSLYATTVSYAIFGWFYINKNYKKFGEIFMLHSTLFIGTELLLKYDTLHVIEMPWFFVFTIFSFLVLGKKFGFLILSLSFLFNTVYLFFFFHSNMTIVLTYITSSHILAVVFNLMMTLFLTAYILIAFKKTHLYAENTFKKANSDLTKQSQLISIQNEEKTIMLKEIHHRVKNNLQVISSLIRLQSFETEDTKAKKMFDATVNRVVAMALIHEKMYQKDNLTKINLANYLKTLANDILKSHQITTHVKFSVESELEIIGNRTIVPLALIFNELISNSLKHAFSDVNEGEIKVNIKNLEHPYFKIDYHDNGVWKEITKASSFGTELIDTFTKQLDGEVNRNSNKDGTTYTFKLKNIE